jgi:flagellar biosynthesis/type III secretory pathway protein FliH
VRRPRFFKNCRTTEEGRKEGRKEGREGGRKEGRKEARAVKFATSRTHSCIARFTNALGLVLMETHADRQS